MGFMKGEMRFFSFFFYGLFFRMLSGELRRGVEVFLLCSDLRIVDPD